MHGLRTGVRRACAGALIVASCASARDATPGNTVDAPAERILGEREPRPWTLQFEPALWYASIAGEQKFGGSSVKTQHIGADDPNASFFGEMHFRSSDLTFSMSGFMVNAGDTSRSRRAFDAGSLSVARGDMVESDIDITSVEAHVGWRVWEWPYASEPARSHDVTMRLDLRAGARFIDMDTRLREPGGGGRYSADGAFAHPLVGFRLEIEMLREFSLDLSLDAGAWPFGSESYSVSVLAGFQWRPHENVGVQIGFRQLFFGLDNDDLDFEGAVGGIMGTVVVRF